MNHFKLPLQNLTISELFGDANNSYEVPIYQRNYAWGKPEIETLIQDVFDSSTNSKKDYFIGTLVTFVKDQRGGRTLYEVIDGQQRLTTLFIVLHALKLLCGTPKAIKAELTFRARERSNEAIYQLAEMVNKTETTKFDQVLKDAGFLKSPPATIQASIVHGFNIAITALREIVTQEQESLKAFAEYLLSCVRIVRYEVQQDVDLNHYFEVMNSRGKQLEPHEIIKARLMAKLKNDEERGKFNRIWVLCSDMGEYIQRKFWSFELQLKSKPERKSVSKELFGEHLAHFNLTSFEAVPEIEDSFGTESIEKLLAESPPPESHNKSSKGAEGEASFLPIIDFPNFLLIVLKITKAQLIDEKKWIGDLSENFSLDDKELIAQFDPFIPLEGFAQQFAFNLLKAKYFLDNYMVHQSSDDEQIGNNPWQLRRWYREGSNQYGKNLTDDKKHQDKLVQLLSMFEVSFTPRQRKNYLFYVMLHLFREDHESIEKYYQFVRKLADKYMADVYLVKSRLSEVNRPTPGSFDEAVISKIELITDIKKDSCDNLNFIDIYGDGTERSKGVPLFVFNYLDYKLWEMYYDKLSGKNTVRNDSQRNEFFRVLGCSDFDLPMFQYFYFSRSRQSLEHFYPQSRVVSVEEQGKHEANKQLPNEVQINCFGNYAMISSNANSSGSNWDPLTKHSHYNDLSGKIPLVGTATLKLKIMMQICEDNQKSGREPGYEWVFTDMQQHQDRMVSILLHGLYSKRNSNHTYLT